MTRASKTASKAASTEAAAESVTAKRITLLQNNQGAVTKVRINDDIVLEVLGAMPTLVNGQMAVSVTIVGATVDAAKDEPASEE